MYVDCRIWNYHVVGGRFNTNFCRPVTTAKDAIQYARETIDWYRSAYPQCFSPNHTSFEIKVYDIERKRRVGKWTIKH